MRLMRPATCLVATLVAAGGLLASAGPVPRALAASTDSIRYVYDADGHLTGVSDPVNGTAAYAYDRVGDLSSIGRATATGTAVLGLSPVSGSAGTQVTITGAGFNPTTSGDTVTFNGTAATVVSAAVNSLVVTVPSGASSGTVTVSDSGGSAASPVAFTVKPAPARPAIGSFSPGLGPAGTQVIVTGTGFDANPAKDVVTFNRTRAVITAASSTSLTVTVPGAAGAGKISVRTPGGVATSSSDFLIPPPYFAASSVESASRVAVDGSSHHLTVSAADDIATMLFDGTPGEHLSIGVTGETFPGQYAIEVYTPWWTLLGTKTFLTADTGWTTYPLPTAGTYQVDIRPLSGTGSANVTLSAAAAAGSLSASGGAVSVPVGAPAGSAGTVTFSGTIGQRLMLGVSTATAGLDPHLSVIQPAGSSFMFDQDLGLSATSPSTDFTLPPLPVSGTYTAVLAPESTVSGSVSVQLLTAAMAAMGPSSATGPRAGTGVTAVTGQVLQLDGRPLAGVTLTMGGRSARTGASGRFVLAGVPAGYQDMVINGATADGKGRSYGLYEDRVPVTAGRTTPLGYPIWMTPLDTRHEVSFSSPAKHRIVLTSPRAPGLEVVIPKGTTIRDINGRVVRKLGLTPIPVSQPPFPLPPGVVTPDYFTVQPGGSHVRPWGAEVIYPNSTHLPPATRVDLWDYDPGGKGWYPYGHGAVTRDGRQIVPDPGARLWEFSGAMLNTSGLSPAPTAPVPSDGGATSSGGDPVDLGTGLLVDRHTDLSEPDTLPISLTRTWRQADSAVRPFGLGQNFSYGIFLRSTNQYQVADLVLPDSSLVHYTRVSSGTSWTDAFFMADPAPTEFDQSSLAWNGNGWDLTLRDGTIYVFGENEPLQSIRDPHGNQIMLTHPVIQSGGVTQITSPNGKWITLSYDNNGRAVQAADNSGRTVSYTYDPAGNLATVTNPAGGVTTYGYNSASQLTSVKDARAITYLTNTYDSAGRVSTQTLANGGVYRFAYTTGSSGQITQTQVTDPDGHVRQVAFNGQGYLVSDTEAAGTSVQQTTTYSRQSGTNWISGVTDPLGNTTAFGYDTAGDSASVTWLAGTSNEVTATTQYNGPFNQVSSVTDQLGNTATLGYDTAGDLTSVTDALGHATTFSYRPDGQLASVTDPAGNTTSYGYQLGDLVSVTDPLGRTSTQSLDDAGRVLTATDPLGDATAAAYDALNQPTSVTDPLGNLTQYSYDANGDLLAVKDAKNHNTSYAYNSSGQVSSFTDPLGHTATDGYDLAGNITSYTSRDGQKTTASYDALNRLTQISYGVTSSGSQSTTSYSYDAGNRVVALSDSAGGSVTFGYDARGNLTGETTPQGSVGYTYDAAGNRSAMTVAGQPQVGYSYDRDGRLTAITQGGATQVGFGYDNAGRPSSTTLPGGASETYGYDAAGQLTSIGYAANGSALGNLTYGYDANGRQAAMGGTFARVSLPSAVTFAIYNAMDQLPSLNGTALSYDADGNLTSDGTNAYTWNARGQLTGVSGPSTSASFGYNGLGQRTSTTVGGNTTGYLYDGANVVQELSGSVPRANLLSGGVDQYFAATSAAGTSGFLTDRLGSTIALTDGTGNPQTQYTYDPYGNPSSSGAASTNTFQFTGQQNDGTGLFYYKSRYYSPALGRFLSADPAGEAAGPNPYQYANGDPANLTDPSGMSPTLLDATGSSGDALSGRKTGSGDGVVPAAVVAVAAAAAVIIAAAPEEGAAIIGIAAADSAVAGAAAVDAAAADGAVAAGADAADATAADAGGTSPPGGSPTTSGDCSAFTAGTSVFWSGEDVAEQAAKAWAKANGGTLVNKTPGGIATKAATMGMDGGDAYEVWRKVSQLFAECASGEVQVFLHLRKVGSNSIWVQNEWPALRSNPNVTGINIWNL